MTEFTKFDSGQVPAEAPASRPQPASVPEVKDAPRPERTLTMTDFKPAFDTEAKGGQVPAEAPASRPEPEVKEVLVDQDYNDVDLRDRVAEATYDVASHNRLPGVDTRGAEAHRPHGQPH
jgi:hypothetical protein